MRKRKLSLWFFYGVSASIVIITLLSVAWYATDRFHEFFIHQMQDTLESRAITVNQSVGDSTIRDEHCRLLEKSDPTIRITIININGIVLCDSVADPQTMETHAQRPEIIKASAGKRGAVIRFSATLKTSMLYLAIPRYRENKIIGVTRTAMPLIAINGLLDELLEQFLILFIFLLVVISIVIIIIFRKISQPLTEIIHEANHYALGDFSKVLPNYDIREISELGFALNRMAKQLDRHETLRKDFVANVSHELKTPIATIKGYVETLLDGAMHNPDDLLRFLTIVLKQNDRLAAIVDDLLTLSRLESAPINQILELSEYDANDILQISRDICQARGDAKHIKLFFKRIAPTPINVDQSLMTQALVNLIDNAIKYSNEHTSITLSIEMKNDQVIMRVQDQGPGIPEEHMPRLFERFYRVDKSRSRRVGGTGLGLAIVKHIVQLHNGHVEISNNNGGGSCFSITLS